MYNHLKIDITMLGHDIYSGMSSLKVRGPFVEISVMEKTHILTTFNVLKA